MIVAKDRRSVNLARTAKLMVLHTMSCMGGTVDFANVSREYCNCIFLILTKGCPYDLENYGPARYGSTTRPPWTSNQGEDEFRANCQTNDASDIVRDGYCTRGSTECERGSFCNMDYSVTGFCECKLIILFR